MDWRSRQRDAREGKMSRVLEGEVDYYTEVDMTKEELIIQKRHDL